MSLKRQTLWSLAPLVVTAVVGFLSAPLFVRFFSDEMYALFFYVTSISTMFGFADLGLGVVIGRNVSMALGKNDLPAVRRYWGTGNLIVLPVLTLITLGFIGVMMWAGPRWFDKLAPADIGLFRQCILVNGLGLFFAYYGTFWLAVSQAHLDFKFIGLIRAVVSPLQIIPQVILAAFTHNPLWILLWGTLVVMAQLVVLIWHARRRYALGFCLGSASLECARELAGYTAKMILALVVGVIFGPMLPNLIGKLALPPALRSFNMANNIAGRLQSLSVAAMGPVLHNTARLANQGAAAAARIYDDSFAFMFDWYLLAALWLALWHPVLLRLYFTNTMGEDLGQKTALATGPLLIPLVLACCFSSLANISNSQLTSMNRLGVTVIFSVAAGLLSIAGILVGWRVMGMTGAVYGYLFSRIALVAQDLYAIRLLKAGGWLDRRTWRQLAGQSLLTGAFALAYLAFDKFSAWLLVPAALHALAGAVWLLRQPLKNYYSRKMAPRR